LKLDDLRLIAFIGVIHFQALVLSSSYSYHDV